MSKIEELRKYLLEANIINKEELYFISVSHYNENIYEINGNGMEFLVLTDEEADNTVVEEIEQSLWAFNTDFILEHSIFDYDDISRKIIKAIAGLYEDGNEAMKKIIDNFEVFVEEAIESDGRGHFISQYDGNEIETENYYIYRMD